MHNAARWFSQLGHPCLLVVGDLMLDRYVWGEAERVSPEAPVLVLREDLDEVRPGGAANVASFLRGLEAEVILAGVVGNDAEGRQLLRLMHDLEVMTDGVIVDNSRPTTTKHRFVGRTAQRQPHQILRVDRESQDEISSAVRHSVLNEIVSFVPSCDAVLISDYDKGVCSPPLLQTVINLARDHGIPVLVDPCRCVDYERYARATLVAPNRVAAELVMDQPLRDRDEILNAARQLRSQFQLDAVVITLDRDGLAFATAADCDLVPCRPREVCDVTGAGDMVLAMLSLCFANGLPLEESLHLANIAAGLEVERFGVEPISRADLLRELSATQLRAITLEELIPKLANDRRAGRTIVFTNGCFDLLHVGHISLLEEAAQLGDVLVVAINSDSSVRKLKGSDRPVLSQEDRSRMLAALACVNHVLIFDDETPHRLLHAIRPDVLVKGGTTDVIVGREVVEAYGGKVIRASAYGDASTTQLIRRLKGTTRSIVHGDE